MPLNPTDNFSQSTEQSLVVQDFHSYSNPQQVRICHLDLELDVSFDQRVLKGTALLTLLRADKEDTATLILDTRDLKIAKVEVSIDGSAYFAAAFFIGQRDPILGSPLMIELPDQVTRVRIEYSTSPD